jgi:hypothetical protein
LNVITDFQPLQNVAIINPLNAKLNPICHLLALLEAHHILHISRIRVKEFDSSNFVKAVQNEIQSSMK